MASRTNVGKKLKGRARKPYSWEEGAVKELPGPTPAEQRKLVDEFRASPRSKIRDPLRDLSEREQLLYRLGESPATAEKTQIIEQIEAADAADTRTNLQPRRLDYRDQPYTSVTQDRSGKVAVEKTAWAHPGGGTFTDAEIEKMFGPGGNPPSKEAIDEQYRKHIRAGALERAREHTAQATARSDFERERAFREGRSTGYAQGEASAAVNELGEFAQSVSKQLTSATDGMDALAKASSKLDGASSEVRIDLLQELQRNPQLQDLVKAGLMRWDDIMIKNPPATDSNHVSNPDGDDPEYVIDRKKLVDLQRKLSDYQTKQTATLSNVQQTMARRRTTPGVVPSARDAIYPGLKVWTPIAWAPALKPGAS